MNWKECGRKRSGGNYKVQAMNLPGGTEESHEDPQDNRSAGRDVKLETSRIRSRNVNHSATTFGLRWEKLKWKTPNKTSCYNARGKSILFYSWENSVEFEANAW
jgi:hypothetical protein